MTLFSGSIYRTTHCAILRTIATAFLLAFPVLASTDLNAQPIDVGHGTAHFHPGIGDEHDKCGPIDEKREAELFSALGPGWGYGYDSLLADLEVWRQSPYVTVISIGTTVQERDIWELTITSPEPATAPRRRVTIHARTHPHETQSWWVCEKVIDYLLSDEPYARFLREQCVFNVIPMYNPDGVEIGRTRENANGVDLEREWDKPNPQPEAAALKQRFSELMNSEWPIEIALNLHSSSDTGRYFWYHDATGTSEEFAQLEQRFINQVRSHFGWINPWSYRVSWINSTPAHFPESWFWRNYGTDVMALTYEDIYGHTPQTPDAWFDSTALALLKGIGDYLELGPTGVRVDAGASPLALRAIGTATGTHVMLRYALPTAGTIGLTLHDALGAERAVIESGEHEAGTYTTVIDPTLPAGVYFARLEQNGRTVVTKVIVLQ